MQVPDEDTDVSAPSVDVDMPSTSVDAPPVDLASKAPDMPSVEGGISGDLPSGDASVTAPDVRVEGGDSSLTAGLAAGGVAALGGIGAAIGLSGDKPDAEVRGRAVSVSAGLLPQRRVSPDTFGDG